MSAAGSDRRAGALAQVRRTRVRLLAEGSAELDTTTNAFTDDASINCLILTPPRISFIGHPQRLSLGAS
jgi:hypothetical protein